MYLKEIKTVGFKSFADKINITFEKGLTGIVGPNGSGKSNIVDAVRWVLGEQSVKSLRGDNSMTDVIFSGSKSRNPSSSASVTLVFDNHDYYFPLSYEEVSIKRVVYKSGDNEYYLNGEKCRLKDITNLVIDLGVGKEAFNIISQGNIQDILSNKPEDRRIIFEEAAGVLKYKRRKEEALRKLDRTHENISRVNDIINELESQVEPLKEQSEKAHVYLDTKKELEQVEIALMVNDIENINNEYQNTKDKISMINEEIVELSKNSSVFQADLEKEKLNYTKDNESLYKIQQKLVLVSSNVERLNGQKTLITERQKYQSEDVKSHDNMLLLKEQQLRIQNNLALIDSDVASKTREFNDNDERITLLEQEITDIKNKRSNLINEIDHNIRAQMELKHKINLMEQAVENNSSLPYAVKVILNNPKLKGIHNIIGKLVTFEDKYATSIDVALGQSSQFVVVDNEECAKEAIRHLKTNNAGRATFFPLNVIKSRNIDPDTYYEIKNHPAFIDIASNLIFCEDKYRNIILNQLGNVIVTTDLDGANEIGKITNHRYRIVTLEGELLHVGGSITGGNIKKTVGVINEKIELAQAEKELSKLSLEYNNLQVKLNSIDILQKEFEAKSYNLQKEKTSINEVITSKLKEKENYKEALNNINNNIKIIDKTLSNTLSSEEEIIMRDYYEALKERDSLSSEIDSLSSHINTSKHHVEEMENNARQAQETFFRKQNDLKDLEIKVNRMDVKLDTLLNNLNEEYMMTFEKAKNEYFLTIDEKEARTKVNSLKNIIRDLGVVNTAAIEEYERISKRYEFLNEQKNDLFKAENTLLEIIKEMDMIMKESFEETFKLVQITFKEVFKKLFGGGSAELKLTDPDNILETGIDIIALPPGKKLQHISLLSGGEKALTAISLLFAILKVRPIPFCLLDEVEAALDEANVEGFASFLKALKDKTQFIVITHKKKMMEYVDVLYGITMQESGVSKLVSVKLEEIK